jgi:hypothetical protein
MSGVCAAIEAFPVYSELLPVDTPTFVGSATGVGVSKALFRQFLPGTRRCCPKRSWVGRSC